MTTKPEAQDDSKAKSAYVLYSQGRYGEAFALYADILKRNPSHYPSLLGYAEEVTRRGNFKEALNVALRVLVHYGTSNQKSDEGERAGMLFAKLIGQTGSVPHLLQLMQSSNSKGGAEALDFLARTAMQNGEVGGSIELFRAAIKCYPGSVKYTNNLIDALEIVNQFGKAFEVAKWFLQANANAEVGGVLCGMVLKAWNEGNAVIQEEVNVQGPMEPEGIEENTADSTPKGRIEENTADSTPNQAKKPTSYNEEQLDLLNFYYKIIKLLYVAGLMKAAEALVFTVQPAKAKGGDLHLTFIRNSNSYFSYIEALVNVGDYTGSNERKDKKTLFVMGDSHVLSPAWRTLQLEKKGEVLMKPLLVTGCKIWHLRKESHFYPKTHFYQLLREVPKQGEVIFMFGEIDCREGILLALAKGIYSTLDQGINVVLDIYLEILYQIAFQKKLHRLYVHPVPPVLEETRWIITAFNRALGARLIAIRQKDSKTPLRWLHIETELLNLGRETFKEEYKLDGTHLHPHYISLISDAINTLETYS